VSELLLLSCGSTIPSEELSTMDLSAFSELLELAVDVVGRLALLINSDLET
jgi:hypothetical protein